MDEFDSFLASSPRSEANMEDDKLKMPYTGEAADNVFQIPEILEMILGYMAGDEQEEMHINNGFVDVPHGTIAPAYSLYRMLQVNKTFRNTIMGSSKLKRLMFLEDAEVSPQDPSYDQCYCGRLTWLLTMMREDCGNKGSNVYFNAVRRVHPGEAILSVDIGLVSAFQNHAVAAYDTAFDDFIAEFQAENGSPRPSWRKIQICPWSSDTIIRVYCTLETHPDQYEVVAWDFAGHMRLRTFFRRYRTFMDALLDHLDTMRRMARKLVKTTMKA